MVTYSHPKRTYVGISLCRIYQLQHAATKPNLLFTFIIYLLINFTSR